MRGLPNVGGSAGKGVYGEITGDGYYLLTDSKEERSGSWRYLHIAAAANAQGRTEIQLLLVVGMRAYLLYAGTGSAYSRIGVVAGDARQQHDVEA